MLINTEVVFLSYGLKLVLDRAQTRDKIKSETDSRKTVFNRWINAAATPTMTSPRYRKDFSSEVDSNYSQIPNEGFHSS